VSALADVRLDDKYTLERGRVYLTGIQALARLLIVQRQRDAAAGLNTAGFVSGFQGSPLNNVDKTMWEAEALLNAHGIRFQPGQNEELAVMGVWGAQQVSLDSRATVEGVFALWYGKWAGLARSGDALLHGNHAGASPKGGVLLVCGDDHMARSSTIATQSETMLSSPMIPVLAPTGVQEYLDLGLHGFAMSRYSGSWVAFKALDDTIECSASVYVDPGRVEIRLPEDFALPPGGLGLRLPDQPLTMERRIHEQRLPAVQAYVRANRLNRVTLPASRTSTCCRRSTTSASTSARPRASACASSRSVSAGRWSRRACTRSRLGSRRSSWSRRSGRSWRTRSARRSTTGRMRSGRACSASGPRRAAPGRGCSHRPASCVPSRLRSRSRSGSRGTRRAIGWRNA
jgi:hypothetical protein